MGQNALKTSLLHEIYTVIISDWLYTLNILHS